jgi:hypothetical protein
MYYKKLDWPVLTEDQHTELIQLASNSQNIKTTGIWFNTYHHYALPAHITDWCRQNLPLGDDYKIVLQRFFNVTTIPLHFDYRRKENFIYLLSESGPITSWHKNETQLDEVCVPKHQWFLLDVGTHHQVTNLKTDRVAISIFKPSSKYFFLDR